MGLQLSDLILSTTLFVNALAIVARKRTTRVHDAPPDASHGAVPQATPWRNMSVTEHAMNADL